MIKIEKILFPTDFSEFSRHAQKYVISFAEQYQAKIYALHVVENFYTYNSLTESAFPVVEMYTEMEKIAEEEMKTTLESFPKNLTVEPITTRGTPFLEIINAAKEKEIDLIVIATHGKTGLDHMFFGSTAEKVVRKSPCPVLTIRNPEHEFVHP